MPRISVIVPAYNVAAYLGRCLDSLKAQQLGDWEAIVVDDCSTDRSGAIADSYAQEDRRIRVIHHGENRGLHLARKAGVEAAAGVVASPRRRRRAGARVPLGARPGHKGQ